MMNLYVLITENMAYTPLKKCGIYSIKKLLYILRGKEYTHDQKMIYTPSQKYMVHTPSHNICYIHHSITRKWYILHRKNVAYVRSIQISIYFIKNSIYDLLDEIYNACKLSKLVYSKRTYTTSFQVEDIFLYILYEWLLKKLRVYEWNTSADKGIWFFLRKKASGF